MRGIVPDQTKEPSNFPNGSGCLGHPLQVLERDLSSLVVVKEAEGFQDLVLPCSVSEGVVIRALVQQGMS